MEAKKDSEPLFPPVADLNTIEVPAGVDRRAFLMKTAVVGAASVIVGCSPPPPAANSAAAPAAPAPPAPKENLSPDLNVVKKAKGPVMTTIDEFYKVGPGPSSSHTIGPMRITYDFYQRCTKLPADQLAKATDAQGSPVRQPERHRHGPRHRARRPWPASSARSRPRSNRRSSTSWSASPSQTLPRQARRQDLQRLAEEHRLRRAEGRLPAPEHDDVQADGRRHGASTSWSTTRSAAGSSSGRATSRPRRAQPKYPYATMAELLKHAEKNKLSIAQVVMANEVAVSGKSEAGDQRLHRQDPHGDGQHRQVRPRRPSPARCPGRSS